MAELKSHAPEVAVHPAKCAEFAAACAKCSVDQKLIQIAQVTNVVMPCFLLELGRRKQHIQVEFPLNPAARPACFRLSVGPSDPMHSLTTDRLLRLVNDAGEALVGLCCFGDHESRERVQTQLTDTI